jgi:hypothetical protein
MLEAIYSPDGEIIDIVEHPIIMEEGVPPCDQTQR